MSARAIAEEATQVRKISIAMAPVADPPATGFAESIARPGGHLTGTPPSRISWRGKSTVVSV